nr:MAG TPA: hypothetical protein [Caudoviricetes sp.]
MSTLFFVFPIISFTRIQTYVFMRISGYNSINHINYILLLLFLFLC